jgi:hypothetical protein
LIIRRICVALTCCGILPTPQQGLRRKASGNPPIKPCRVAAGRASILNGGK